MFLYFLVYIFQKSLDISAVCLLFNCLFIFFSIFQHFFPFSCLFSFQLFVYFSAVCLLFSWLFIFFSIFSRLAVCFLFGCLFTFSKNYFILYVSAVYLLISCLFTLWAMPLHFDYLFICFEFNFMTKQNPKFILLWSWCCTALHFL